MATYKCPNANCPIGTFDVPEGPPGLISILCATCHTNGVKVENSEVPLPQDKPTPGEGFRAFHMRRVGETTYPGHLQGIGVHATERVLQSVADWLDEKVNPVAMQELTRRVDTLGQVIGQLRASVQAHADELVEFRENVARDIAQQESINADANRAWERHEEALQALNKGMDTHLEEHKTAASGSKVPGDRICPAPGCGLMWSQRAHCQAKGVCAFVENVALANVQPRQPAEEEDSSKSGKLTFREMANQLERIRGVIPPWAQRDDLADSVEVLFQRNVELRSKLDAGASERDVRGETQCVKCPLTESTFSQCKDPQCPMQERDDNQD